MHARYWISRGKHAGKSEWDITDIFGLRLSSTLAYRPKIVYSLCLPIEALIFGNSIQSSLQFCLFLVFFIVLKIIVYFSHFFVAIIGTESFFSCDVHLFYFWSSSSGAKSLRNFLFLALVVPILIKLLELVCWIEAELKSNENHELEWLEYFT